MELNRALLCSKQSCLCDSLGSMIEFRERTLLCLLSLMASNILEFTESERIPLQILYRTRCRRGRPEGFRLEHTGKTELKFPQALTEEDAVRMWDRRKRPHI